MALLIGLIASVAYGCTADGVVINSIGGAPVAHAQVIANTKEMRGASTDAAGKWTIADLPCEVVRFSVQHAGFLGDPKKPDTPALLPAHDLTVSLMPESAISGRVLDEAGEPVPGASVECFASAVSAGRRTMQTRRTANADDQGQYRIGMLPAGRYLVCARSSRHIYPVGGGGPLTFLQSCYPGDVSSGSANALRLPAGDEARADLTLAASPGVHVRGKVSGAPDGARVLVQMGQEAAQKPDGGRFDFPGVVPGRYTVQATAVADGKTLLAATPLDVGFTNVDADLTFAEAVSVSGTVRFETARGDAPNLTLIPSEPGGSSAAVEWDEDRTAFTMSSVVPGRYRLNIAQPRPPWYIKSATLLNQDIQGRELTVTAPTGPIEIVLANDGGRLEGEILDAESKPVPGEVILIRENRTPLIQKSDDGRFAIGDIPPGDYTAYAFDNGENVEYAEPEWMKKYAGAGKVVTVAPNASIAISLSRVSAPEM